MSTGCITGPAGDTLRIVPTTRPRHLVTETDELTSALDAAARRWPDLSRPQLLVRLALEGHRTNVAVLDRKRHQRLAALDRYEGALPGVYGPDALAERQADWPS